MLPYPLIALGALLEKMAEVVDWILRFPFRLARMIFAWGIFMLRKEEEK